MDCPSCGSDDLTGEQNPGGTITLTCQACQASWDRVPQLSCPRCGRGDIEEYGAQDWVYDDPAEAKDDREAPGHSRGGRTFRCRRCNNAWGQAR